MNKCEVADGNVTAPSTQRALLRLHEIKLAILKGRRCADCHSAIGVTAGAVAGTFDACCSVCWRVRNQRAQRDRMQRR